MLGRCTGRHLLRLPFLVFTQYGLSYFWVVVSNTLNWAFMWLATL